MIINTGRINFSYIWRSIKQKLPFGHTNRNVYLIGKTDLSIQEFEDVLIKLGYQYNYFSFTEKGQISNMRRLYIENNIIRQIHIRLYNDKEVRIHDEYAYEYDAINHVKAVTLQRPNILEENRIAELLKISK